MTESKDFEKQLRECNMKLYEAEIRNQRKIEFITHLSHEFKTPLNAINGFTSLMYETELPRGKQIKFLENIMNAANHLRQVVDYTIEMAMADTDKIKLYYEKFEPNEVIMEVLAVLGERFKEKNLKIETQLAKGKITADKRRFRQLMYNLAGNACKFNKTGGFIRINTTVDAEIFSFEIEDTGEGIKKSRQKDIFESFTHIDDSKFKNQEGTGIGLSVCKKIVELHQGRIEFESIPEKGSVFRFFIPQNSPVSGGHMVLP